MEEAASKSFGIASIQAYLDTCCNETLSNFSTELSLISGVTCCLLGVTGINLDVVTTDIHPVYVSKDSVEYERYKESGDTSSGASTEPEPTIIEDYSNYTFLQDVWNRRESWEVAAKSVAVAPVMLIAIVGNLAVIRTILKARLTRNPINMFILNMSIADILCALFFPAIILVSDLYQSFMLGNFICRTEGFVLVTLMLASILSLTAISYDRLKAVVFPFKPRMDRRRAKIVIWTVWVIAMGLASPLIIWRSYHERQWKNFLEKWCKEDIQRLRLYWLVLIILMVWIPLAILTISYSAIVIKLDTLEKRQKDHPAQVKLKSKVVRMLFAIVILFTVCWSPFAAYVIFRNNRDDSTQVPGWLRHMLFVSHYLMFINSAINPIIYGLKNDNLKREMRLALPACMRTKETCEISAVYNGGGKNREKAPRGQQKINQLKKNEHLKFTKDRNRFWKGNTNTSSFDENSPASILSMQRNNSALEDIGINFNINTSSTKLYFED